MNLPTRKLKAIEYVLKIEDEAVLNEIEATIENAKSKYSFSRLTSEQMVDRANESNQNYTAGKYKTQDQLEKESAKW
jgi:hypothetical protein